MVQKPGNQASLAKQVEAELIENRGDGGVVATQNRLHRRMPQRVTPEQVIRVDGGRPKNFVDERNKSVVQDVLNLVLQDATVLKVIQRLPHAFGHRLFVGAGVMTLEHILQKLAQGIAASALIVGIFGVQ